MIDSLFEMVDSSAFYKDMACIWRALSKKEMVGFLLGGPVTCRMALLAAYTSARHL
jgi:hypothetical protein